MYFNFIFLSWLMNINMGQILESAKLQPLMINRNRREYRLKFRDCLAFKKLLKLNYFSSFTFNFFFLLPGRKAEKVV